jgi:hypothetical protein
MFEGSAAKDRQMSRMRMKVFMEVLDWGYV